MNSTVLLQQLKSPDPARRQQAMLEIGNSLDPQLMSPLAVLATPDTPEIEQLFIKYLQNWPLEQSLPYLLPLGRSPNEATRKNLFAALDQIDPEQDEELIKKILACAHEPLSLFMLQKLEICKREILLPAVASLLSAPSRVVAEAAFKLITGWNFSSSIPLILPLLKSGQSYRQVLAISALGRLSAFKKWKQLLPFLHSREPEVRQAVVQSLRLCAGKPLAVLFLKALKREKDAEVMKVLITALSGAQRIDVACELIRLAALHPVLAVRKTANWVVNECPVKTVQKSIAILLNPQEETLCRFLITKIGELKLAACGHLVVSFLKDEAPAPLRYAALESLCLLKESKYLARIRPYIKSNDAMEAYLAVMAAANTAASLDECSELKDVLFSNNEVLKQTLLELMNGPLHWNTADESISGMLKANLENSDVNTRYLSLFLIKQAKDRSFIPRLTQVAVNDTDQAVRDAALQCLDTILGGDMGYFLETLSRPCSAELRRITMTLLPQLSWDRTTALQAITFFACEHRQEMSGQLMQLAAKLYPVCPRETEDFIRQEPNNTPWLLALASAWLANLNPLNGEANKGHWLTLLAKGIPGLQPLLIRKAVDNKSKWAVPPLQQSLERISDPDAAGITKQAIKTLIEL